MIGDTQVTVTTEQIAYPLESDYYPMIRVFESPYTVGDCPIDEVTLTDTTSTTEWRASENGYTRARIRENEVFIAALEGNNYEIDKQYELRIYASDEVVDYEEEQQAV